MAQTPVASVNGQTIDIEELADVLSEFASRGVPSDKLREQLGPALRELILERLAEQAVAGAKNAQNERLTRRAERAKRRMMLEAYYQAGMTPPPVSQSDIDLYVKNNPDFFKDRKTFHFTEIVARAPTQTSGATLGEELRSIVAARNPRPARIDVLIDWLRANKIGYSSSKQWRGSEQVPGPLLDQLKRLDRQPVKSELTEQDGAYRLVVLFDSFADPVNPAHAAANIVQQVLGREASEKNIRDLGEALIAKAKVEIFEKNLDAALARPLASAQQAPRASNRQTLLWTLQFLALFLAPFALLAFYRRDAVAAGLTTRDSSGRHFSHSREARVFVIGVLGALLLMTAAYVLFASNVLAFATDAAVAAAAALAIAGVIVLLFWKVPLLAALSNYRWASIGVVAVLQSAAFALVG